MHDPTKLGEILDNNHALLERSTGRKYKIEQPASVSISEAALVKQL
jgi:hypothetical protein